MLRIYWFPMTIAAELWLLRGCIDSIEAVFRGSRGAPFGEDTLSPLRRYLKPLPKGGGGGRGGEQGTEAPLRYLKGASKASKVP